MAGTIIATSRVRRGDVSRADQALPGADRRMPSARPCTVTGATQDYQTTGPARDGMALSSARETADAQVNP
jgi:hypothetical protein